jgi:hypothetical protein
MRPSRTLLSLASISLPFALALASPARAQSPRAGAPTPGDGEGSRLSVDVGSTGNLSRGLVYRDLLTNRAVLQAWTGPWGLYVQPYWLYSRIGTATGGRITADNDIYVRTGGFRNLTPSVFAFAVNVYDHSLRRKVAHRELFGGGAGVNVIAGKPVALAVSAAVLGELTDFDADTLRIDDAPVAITGTRSVLRGAARLHGRYRLADDRLVLVHDLIVLPALRDPTSDYRVLFSGSLDAPIVKGFAARAQADATHDEVIVDGTKRDALVITFGVAYRAEWQARRE